MRKNKTVLNKEVDMTSIADISVCIQTSSESVPFFSRKGEDRVRGCVTSQGRRSWTAPLAHGGKACYAQNTVPPLRDFSS